MTQFSWVKTLCVCESFWGLLPRIPRIYVRQEGRYSEGLDEYGPFQAVILVSYLANYLKWIASVAESFPKGLVKAEVGVVIQKLPSGK